MHARQGELRVMVGGDEGDFAASKAILETIGKEVTYLGGNGMGATMKLVLNMLMGVQMPALAEAVVFGERAGLPREKILEMIAESGYSSPVMTLPLRDDGRARVREAAFKLGLMRKDMMLVLERVHRSSACRCPCPRAPTRCSRPPSSRASASSTWRRSWPSRSACRAWRTIRGRGSGRRRCPSVLIIDVHGHITHPELFKRIRCRPPGGHRGDARPEVRGRHRAHGGREPRGLRDDDAACPGLDNYAQPLDQLKSFHEWLAETVAKHAAAPGRVRVHEPFGGDEMLEQTAQTVRDGGFVGLIVNTSVKGEYLDSERADPFFEMASELGVPVFLHPPAEPVGSDSLRGLPPGRAGGPVLDVTVGLAALVFGGRLERYPDLNSSRPRRAARSRSWPPGSTRRTAAALGRRSRGTVAGRPVDGRRRHRRRRRPR